VRELLTSITPYDQLKKRHQQKNILYAVCMNLKKFLYELQLNGVSLFGKIAIASYIISIIGLATTQPKYIDTLNTYVKIYACLFLIYRFNRFRKNVKFTELDRKIVFSVALFMLATVAVDSIAMSYFNKAKSKFESVTREVTSKLPIPIPKTTNPA